MTAAHRVKRFEYRFLQSGHSHEDIDRFFSTLSNLIESHKTLEAPADFQSMLEDLLADPAQRPDEQSFRSVRLVDTVRDWCLASKQLVKHVIVIPHVYYMTWMVFNFKVSDETLIFCKSHLRRSEQKNQKHVLVCACQD